MTIRVVVVDDEPVARRALVSLLTAYDWVECVGTAADGPTAIEVVNRLVPDVLFLDVQMPGCSGIDVARQLVHRPTIVFTTAFGEHAVLAFELGAVDYLLKPFGAPRLATCMARLKAMRGETAPEPSPEQLADVSASGPVQRIFVRGGAGITPVLLQDVLWLEADGDYVVLHTATGRHFVHVALHRLEQRLEPAEFLRIHRGCVVNLSHVQEFRRGANGVLNAVMRNGVRLAVSRARAQSVRARGM
ncbi:MAG: response regulator transcription factor [Gemmatimonadaceae bacterium]|nr:response regulator transcription factor [Gemmatimonadaceae bacterium]